MAYCTHCKTEYPIGIGQAAYKHNEEIQCFNCQSKVTVKSNGRGRKKMVDDAYFVWYEKSRINPKAIVARGIYAIRDYRGDYRNVTTQFQTSVMYLFEPVDGTTPANTVMFKESGWYPRTKWQQSKTVGTLVNSTMKYKRCFMSEDSVERAVEGTPFQYSMWREYAFDTIDLVKFFDLAAKYPCVEYLTKLGLRSVVEHKLSGIQTYGVVNWRGKTIDKVLRMSKTEIKQVVSAKFRVEPLSLYSLQYHKRLGVTLTFDEAHQLRELSQGYYHTELMKLLQFSSRERILRYLLKQSGRPENKFSRVTILLADWRDYVGECQELGMDLSKEHVLFPNNLKKSHEKTTEKVRLKADNALNILIAQRLRELQKYSFEHDGMFLRPAMNTAELFREGKELSHCVGRYSKTYAEGKTNLFVLRKADEPEAPFYTIEIIDGNIIQARGYKNCNPTEEVDEFLAAFSKAKLKKRKKQKAKIDRRMEVAV